MAMQLRALSLLPRFTPYHSCLSREAPTHSSSRHSLSFSLLFSVRREKDKSVRQSVCPSVGLESESEPASEPASKHWGEVGGDDGDDQDLVAVVAAASACCVCAKTVSQQKESKHKIRTNRKKKLGKISGKEREGTRKLGSPLFYFFYMSLAEADVFSSVVVFFLNINGSLVSGTNCFTPPRQRRREEKEDKDPSRVSVSWLVCFVSFFLLNCTSFPSSSPPFF